MSATARSAAIPVTASFHAARAMVASNDHLATTAALGVLGAGGSAADAALTAASVLAVTSPQACGLGGDMFALVHQPPSGAPTALCSAGWSGSGADPEALRAEGHTAMPPRDDIRSATVPGCVDGWLALHARFGRLPLFDVLRPAITFAEQGFPISNLLTGALAQLDGVPVPPEFASLQPRVGSMLRRPGLAAALRAVAGDGRDGFYSGPFAAGMVELGHGWFTEQDFSVPLAHWVEPLRVRVWGNDVWTVPPPSQGYVSLLSAAVAGQLPLPNDPDRPEWVHLLVEAAIAGGQDRPTVLRDGADVRPLLAEAEVNRRAGDISVDRVSPIGLRVMPGDTTYLCVVDEERMAVSLMQSNAAAFGTRIFEPATGIELQNRGVAFSLRPGDPVELGPRRRPPHTLSPALATTPAGALRAVLGAAGADAQPHVVLQLLARLLAAGQTVGEAVGAPRFRLGASAGTGFDTWTRPDGLTVWIEEGAPEAWRSGLIARGHEVVTRPAGGAGAGHANLVELGDNGVLAGACDPRTQTGAVSGF